MVVAVVVVPLAAVACTHPERERSCKPGRSTGAVVTPPAAASALVAAEMVHLACHRHPVALTHLLALDLVPVLVLALALVLVLVVLQSKLTHR